MIGRKYQEKICDYTYDVGDYPSAKAILDAGKSQGSGTYLLTVNGNRFCAYCDMTTDGGGWTLVMNKVASQWTYAVWNTVTTQNIENAVGLNTGLFKFSDEIINAIAAAGNGWYRLSSYGTYNITKYAKNLTYGHTSASLPDANLLYPDLTWTNPMPAGLTSASYNTGIGNYPGLYGYVTFITGARPDGTGGYVGSDTVLYNCCNNNLSDCNFRMFVK